MLCLKRRGRCRVSGVSPFMRFAGATMRTGSFRRRKDVVPYSRVNNFWEHDIGITSFSLGPGSQDGDALVCGVALRLSRSE